jgi:hypothetical protein
MRAHNEQKANLQKRIEKKCVGEDYEKTRQQKGVKPPGFIQK